MVPRCPVCNGRLRHRRGLFECLTCEFVGDSARVLRTKSLKGKGEARLRALEAETDLLLDALVALQTQGNELPLKELLNTVDTDPQHNATPTLASRRNSRGKYVLAAIASAMTTAFAEWFVFSFHSLVEGNVTTLQAAPPFTCLFAGIGSFLYLAMR